MPPILLVKVTEEQNSIRYFAETTTIHGVNVLVFTKSLIFKILWALLMALSIGLMCSQLYATSQAYLENPTAISMSAEPLVEIPLLMVCPDQWFTDDKARRIFSPEDIVQIRNALNMNPNTTVNPEMLNSFEKYFSENKSEIIKIMANNSLQTLQDIVNLISFDPEVVLPSPKIPGTYQNVFSTTKIYNVAESSVCYGAQASQTYDTAMVSVEMPGDGYLTVSQGVSFAEQKHEYKDGQTIRVKLLAEMSIMINKSSKPCYDVPSECRCMEQCNLEYTMCRVAPWKIPHYTTRNESFFSLYFWRDMLNLTEEEICKQKEKVCCSKCNPCITWNFNTIISASRYNQGNTSITFTVSRDVRKIKEHYSYSLATLLGNVGGLVSLYVGASVLSLAHILFFCCSRVCKFKKGN